MCVTSHFSIINEHGIEQNCSLCHFYGGVSGFIWMKSPARVNCQRSGQLSCCRGAFILFRLPNPTPTLGWSRHLSWPMRTRCTCCGLCPSTSSSPSEKYSSLSQALSSPTLRWHQKPLFHVWTSFLTCEIGAHNINWLPTNNLKPKHLILLLVIWGSMSTL